MHSNHISPHSYNSDEEDQDLFQLVYTSKRKRSSRACDQCRKSKSKCLRAPNSVSCANCLNLNLECTFLGPNRKRGPPKGYIVNLEHRVHRLEALMGIILSSADPAVRSLLMNLSEDALARDIIADVENSPFGPTGKITSPGYLQRNTYQPNQNDSNFVSSRDRREQLIIGNEIDPSLPSYQWQDQQIFKLNSRLKSTMENFSEGLYNGTSYAFTPEKYSSPHTASLALPPVPNSLPNLGSYSLATRRPDEAEMIWKALYNTSQPSSAEESDYESDNPADAVGQLALNEKEEIGFLGKTSGMHLLAKPRRRDNLRNGGIWHLPQSRHWPKSVRGGPMFEEDLGLNITLPPGHIQDNLLSLYWKYVQPILPVIDKERFLKELLTERQHSGSSRKIPRLLLLAMFTVSARYANYDPLPTKGTMWEAGCDYLDQAKHILNWTYDSPRTSTCQALILLAYREFGIGAISQAWLYMGMAIRMATELGIHRSADRWQLGGRVLFSEAEISLRKRLWHCCVLLDRIMAFVMGRPMCIRERDYDIALPDLEQNEELEMWSPQEIGSYYTQPCYTISTLHATSSLSSLLALVVDTIYACRSGVSFKVRHVESFKISARLQTWYEQLPEHLKYSNKDEFVPLPHILTLHMTYWCVMLLVHRPFIRHHTSDGSDEELVRMSEKSLSESQNAASRISNLVATYRQSWNLSCANAYLGWLVLTSGIMHVATLTMNSKNQLEARTGLQHCLDALDDMKMVWPSSERALQLLRGAEVDNNAVKSLSNPFNGGDRSNTYHDGNHNMVHPTPHQVQSSTWSPAPPRTDWSSEPSTFGSFLASMTSNLSVPAELSYFPGYEHWPPEFLVFQPHHSHSPYYDYNNQNST